MSNKLYEGTAGMRKMLDTLSEAYPVGPGMRSSTDIDDAIAPTMERMKEQLSQTKEDARRLAYTFSDEEAEKAFKGGIEDNDYVQKHLDDVQDMCEELIQKINFIGNLFKEDY